LINATTTASFVIPLPTGGGKQQFFSGNQNDGMVQHDKKSSCFNTTELSRVRTSKCWKGFT
jgi:hypothetical protein